MNIKSIQNVNEQIAIYIGLIATFTLIISLFGVVGDYWMLKNFKWSYVRNC